MLRLATRRTLAALAVTLVAGCQSVPSMTPGTSLAFGAIAPEPAAQPIAAAAVSAPEPPAPVNAPLEAVPTAAPVMPSSGSGGGHHHSNPAPAPTGSVTVDLSSIVPAAPAAQRRILSSVADIASLVVTISMTGQADRIVTVTVAEMLAGKTSVTFDSLPTGTCTITIKALDAANASIGTSSRLAAIAASKETKAQLRTLIVPDDGMGYSYANSLLFNVDLEAAPPAQAPDGSGPVPGTVLDTLAVPVQTGFYFGNNGMYADNAGHLYVRIIIPLGFNNRFMAMAQQYSTADGTRGTSYRLSIYAPLPSAMVYDPLQQKMTFGTFGPGATVTNTQDANYVVNARVNGMAIDSHGDTYVIRTGKVAKIAAGTETLTEVPVQNALEVDSADNMWVSHPNNGATSPSTEVRRYAPDGSLSKTCPVPFPVTRLISDKEGGMWVCDRPGGQIAHITADGTVGPALGIAANDMCVDASKHVWIAGANAMLELDNQGLELAQFPIQAKAITAGDGYVFASVDFATVLKIQP